MATPTIEVFSFNRCKSQHVVEYQTYDKSLCCLFIGEHIVVAVTVPGLIVEVEKLSEFNSKHQSKTSTIFYQKQLLVY
ncbi:uncharacterized protein CANTADRAFT_26119, partial [Suhomyces tanzawaensis NRRL Y-17324]